MPGTVSLALLPALTLLFGTINHDGNPNICNCIKLTEYMWLSVSDEIQHFPALCS